MADLSQTATSVIPSPAAQYFNPGAVLFAGVALSAGQPVYQNQSDLAFYPADADGASPLYQVVGVAVNSPAAGQPVAVVVSDPQLNLGATLVVGQAYIVSAAAGKICPHSDHATGWFVSLLGVAITTALFKLSINRSDVAAA